MNELLERYVREVEKRLSRHQREDVGRELRSLLAESIEARVEQGEDSESATAAVLGDFGPPTAAAARYRTDSPWGITPELLPAFRRTVAGALTVLGALAFAGLIWTVPKSADRVDALVHGLVEALTNFLSNGFQVVGVLFVGFVVAGWLGAGREPKREWNPRNLPPLDADGDDDSVRRPRVAVGMAISIVFVACVVLWGDRLGVRGTVDGDWAILARPGEGFWRLVPWLLTVWVAEIVLDGLVLLRGRWTGVLRFAELIAKAAGLVLLGWMAVVPDLLAFDFGEVGGLGLDPVRIEHLRSSLLPLLEKLLRAALALTWVFVAFDFGRRVWRLATGRSGQRP